VDSESRLREQREKEDRDMLKRRAEAEEQRRIRELEKWKQANQNTADEIAEQRRAEHHERLRKLEEEAAAAAAAEQQAFEAEAKTQEEADATAREADEERLAKLQDQERAKEEKRLALQQKKEKAKRAAELRRRQRAAEQQRQSEVLRLEREQAAREKKAIEDAMAAAANAKDPESIRKQCSEAGVPFTDADFTGDGAIFMDTSQQINRLKVQEWLRPAQFYTKPTLTKNNHVAAEEISQGNLGDCWLLSAMSVLARRPELMDKVLAVKEYNDEGVYAVNLYKNGKWIQVIVDDLFPCIPRPTVRNPDRMIPAYCRSKTGDGLWMSVIEKAYAKYHGSYEGIEGGLVHLGLVDLTGGAGEEIRLAEPQTKRAISSGALWRRLMQYSAAGHLLGAGTPAGVDTNISAMGIVQGHAYAILRVEEESDTNGEHKLIQLRNPWGQTEWKGDWCDTDTFHWTRRIKHMLSYDPEEETDSDDGVFWMSFADFVHHFASIYVCCMFTEVQNGGSWYRYTGVGRWSGDTAGGAPTSKHVNARNNPQVSATTQLSCPTYLTVKICCKRFEISHPCIPLLCLTVFVANKQTKQCLHYHDPGGCGCGKWRCSPCSILCFEQKWEQMPPNFEGSVKSVQWEIHKRQADIC
jgi:hypothetical protein